MTNAELINKIEEIHRELTEICHECQEFNCDYCPYKILRSEDFNERY